MPAARIAPSTAGQPWQVIAVNRYGRALSGEMSRLRLTCRRCPLTKTYGHTKSRRNMVRLMLMHYLQDHPSQILDSDPESLERWLADDTS